MTTKTLSAARVDTGLISIITVAFIGLATMFIAGHAQSAVLHDAAHDVRHATGLPCH
jgi:cobalt transporter subunit CbtB